MRLDHLLSKENIVYFCFVAWLGVWLGAWLVTVFCHCLVSGLDAKWWQSFLFSGESKYRTWLYARVGGSVKQG